MSDNKKFHFSTKAIKIEHKPSKLRENSSSLFLNSGFRFTDSKLSSDLFKENVVGHIYSRFGNPNTDEFVDKMCALEKMDMGFATSTGMGSIFLGLASFLNSGDHIVASRSLFASSHELLTKIFPRWNVSFSYVEINDPNSWEKSFKKNTKIFFIETPSNPGLDLIDIQFAAKLAHSNNALLMVDNCFATPYLQKPAIFGADIIAHSATKFIDGQGRVMGGVILSSNKLFPEIKFMARHSGPIMSSFNAWMLSKSLETLSIRMDAHCKNAIELATRLEQHKEVKRVIYPFLKSHHQYDLARKQMKLGGGLLSFELAGDINRCIRFVDSLKLIIISSNLGDTRTLITHPFLTTHSKLTSEERLKVGISDQLLRVSLGLENIEDIWNDIDQAIKQSA